MTIITLTKPMIDFKKEIANGEEIAKQIDLSNCTEFWIASNAEILIYSKDRNTISCSYSEYYNKIYITDIWDKSGCIYKYEIDYDKIESEMMLIKKLKKQISKIWNTKNITDIKIDRDLDDDGKPFNNITATIDGRKNRDCGWLEDYS